MIFDDSNTQNYKNHHKTAECIQRPIIQYQIILFVVFHKQIKEKIASNNNNNSKIMCHSIDRHVLLIILYLHTRHFYSVKQLTMI